MNIEAEKAMIIEKVKQVSDIDLISAIKSMLDYAQKRDQKVYDIPGLISLMDDRNYRFSPRQERNYQKWDKSIFSRICDLARHVLCWCCNV